jgi:uncharacterized protein (DUF1501 family)
MYRRDFLKLGTLGIGSLVLPNILHANNQLTGYKAIVVVYLAGGNDGTNMFVPSGNDSKKGYQAYADARDILRVKETSLNLPLTGGELDLSGGNPYDVDGHLDVAYTKGFYEHNGMDIATNGLMPEIAHLLNQGSAAVVANAGNLIAPANKADFRSRTKPLPPFLFAHNHQTKLMMNGEAAKLDYTGWAGRLYDNWKRVNGGDIYGFNIGIGGNEHLFYGDETTPMIISSNGPTQYHRINRKLHDDYMKQGKDDAFRQLYNAKRKHSFEMQDTIVEDWKNKAPTFTATNAYGKELFSYPTNEQLSQDNTTMAGKSMLKNLKAVANLAYIGKNRGLKREVFYMLDGGYDTHGNQTKQHARKLRGLSLGIGDFYKALKEKGMENDVTVITVSDFGRSIGNNGDGTDHAWGSNHLVVGGAVKRGLYGKLPSLILGGDDDLGSKGRLIPTTSMTQYYATVLKWFGVDNSLMPIVLPELSNFSVSDLGFMG